MWLLRKEIDNLILILLFSSFLLILFILPEVNSYSLEEYMIGIFLIFLISLILFKKYGFQIWAKILVLFLIFTLVRIESGILAPAIVFITFPFYWEKQKGNNYKKIIKEYGLQFKFKYLVYGLFGFFGVFFLVLISSLIFHFLGINDQQNVKEVVRSLPLISVPFAIFFAPVAEEFFFRGFLSKKIGILFSAIVFSLLHFAYGSIVEIAVAFVIALFFSYLFIKTKSLWPSIIAHSFFNLIALVIMWLL